MSIERVRAYLATRGMADRIQEFDVSSATVELAAQALGVEVYLDESLRRFDTVFPAAGSANSAIELTCE